MIPIISLEANGSESPGIALAQPAMFKAFWPEVRGSYFFRNRRAYLEFMHTSGSRIYYLPHVTPYPPFVLIGNWRSRSDITALWHIRAEGADRERLVTGAARICFDGGSERFVTKPVCEREAEQFEGWGFEPAYKVVMLEKQLQREAVPPAGAGGVDIIRYRKKALDEVLKVDATAFDDFWRLDARTLENVANSCLHNIFLLAMRDGQTLGYALGGANGRLGDLQRLGVHADHQGEGIGDALVRHLLHALHAIGASMVMVNTQDDNLAALGLYRKLGFREMQDPRLIMQCTAQNLQRGRR